VTKDRLIAAVTENTIDRDGPGFMYEFDYRLRIINVEESGVNVAQLHRQLELQGKLNHRFDPTKEANQLKNDVGIRWNNLTAGK
jgi:hypothetical protein